MTMMMMTMTNSTGKCVLLSASNQVVLFIVIFVCCPSIGGFLGLSKRDIGPGFAFASFMDNLSKGSMDPLDANAISGETIILDCTLDRSKTSASVDRAYFKPGTNIMSARESGSRDWYAPGVQTVLDNDTLRLTLVNATKGKDNGTVYCYLNNTEDPTTHVASATIQIGDLPEIGKMTCVSHNHQDLNCSFCPENYPPDIWTYYNIEYAINALPDAELVPCQLYQDCVCYWCGLYDNSACEDENMTFIPSGWYKVNVTAVDKLNRKNSQIFEFKADASIVKVDPVKHLQVTNASREIEGSFEVDSILGYMDILHTLYVRTENSQLPNNTIIELGTNTTFRVSGLHPYTQYEVYVTSRVKESPYDSEPAHISVRTLSDAPASGPPIPPGALRMGQQCQRPNLYCHPNTFFWGVIDELDRNGNINGYMVSVYDESANRITGPEDMHTSTSFTYDMIDGQHYDVCVRAYNFDEGEKKGNIYLLSNESCIHRQPVKEMPPNAVVKAERLDMTIMMDITPPQNDDITNMTVFACEPKTASTTECMEAIWSEVIPADTRKYNRSYEENLMYSISSNTAKGSSGMTPEWICFFAYAARAGQVDSLKVEAREERSLSVSWEPPLCTEPNVHGRVLNYTLNYACQTGENLNVTVSVETTEYLIEDLSPYTEYNVSVVAEARGGPGDPLPTLQRTKQSAPGLPPQNVTVLNVTAFDFFLTFEPSPEPNGEVDKYVITVKEGNSIVTTETTQHLQAWITGLEGYKNYSVSVQAVNSAGYNSSPLQYIQTRIGAPSMITKNDITAKKLDSDSDDKLRVTWRRPAKPNGPIDNYEIRISQKDKNVSVTVPGHELKHIYTYPCDDTVLEVNVTVVAINRDPENDGEELRSEESPEPATEFICKKSQMALIVGISLLAFFLLIWVGILIYCCCPDWCRKKMHIPIKDIPDPEGSQNTGNHNRAFEHETDSAYPYLDPQSEKELKINGSGGPLLSSHASTDSGNSGSIHSQSSIKSPPSSPTPSSDGYMSSGSVHEDNRLGPVPDGPAASVGGGDTSGGSSVLAIDFDSAPMPQGPSSVVAPPLSPAPPSDSVIHLRNPVQEDSAPVAADMVTVDSVVFNIPEDDALPAVHSYAQDSAQDSDSIDPYAVCGEFGGKPKGEPSPVGEDTFVESESESESESVSSYAATKDTTSPEGEANRIGEDSSGPSFPSGSIEGAASLAQPIPDSSDDASSDPQSNLSGSTSSSGSGSVALYSKMTGVGNNARAYPNSNPSGSTSSGSVDPYSQVTYAAEEAPAVYEPGESSGLSSMDPPYKQATNPDFDNSGASSVDPYCDCKDNLQFKEPPSNIGEDSGCSVIELQDFHIGESSDTAIQV